MSNKTTINIKTDKELKESAKKTAEELGFSLSAVIRAQLKQLVRDKRVEFSVPQEPNEETKQLLKEAMEDFENGENIAGPFETAEEMDAWLNGRKDES
jgi:addiction module RelB/DinJ family antitoxin